MKTHQFEVKKTGGPNPKPMIDFGFDFDDSLEEDISQILKTIGFTFSELKYIGPYAIPEMCWVDSYFKSDTVTVVFSVDNYWKSAFIHTDSLTDIIEKIAMILKEDQKFKECSPPKPSAPTNK